MKTETKTALMVGMAAILVMAAIVAIAVVIEEVEMGDTETPVNGIEVTIQDISGTTGSEVEAVVSTGSMSGSCTI